MKKPGKLRKDQLEHPKDSTYVAWNGDVRKKRNPKRWNGSPDMEDTGFTSRGVTSTTAPIKQRDSKETTGRSIQPPPKSLIVGGLNNHRNPDNIPKEFSPLAPRPAGKPPCSELTLRQSGTDGKAQ